MAQKLCSNIPYDRNDNIVTEKLSTCASALDDLKDIYYDTFLTDVNIKTKTCLFPAHKIVLSARSPVFKVMFIKDLRKKNSDTIQIDDLEDDTVQQLLVFLYSDTVEDLHWGTAYKLYYAAVKYQIEKLKLMCSSFLIENLTASTATELLLLADSHSDSDLKKVVEDFISMHEEEVFSSEKWEELMKVNPQLALKLMHTKYKTKKSDGRRYTRPPPSDLKKAHNDLLSGKEKKVLSSDDYPKKKFPGSFFPRMARKNNSLSTPDSMQDVANAINRGNERYQQKQMNQFQAKGIQNIASESTSKLLLQYFENSDADMKTHNFVDASYYYNKRQKASKNPRAMTFKVIKSPELHMHGDSTEAEKRKFYDPEMYSENPIINDENSIELLRRGEHQQKQMNKFQDFGTQNIAPESSSCENSDVDMKTHNFIDTSYSYNKRQEASKTPPAMTFKVHASPELHMHGDSTEAEKRKFYDPEMYSENPIINNGTSKELLRRGQHHQKEMNKFHDIGTQNIAPESSSCENSDVDMKTHNFVDTNYSYNKRQETSENDPSIMFKKLASPESDIHGGLTEARRRRFYHPENHSERMIINNETTKELYRSAEHQQKQMNKFQDSGIQNIAPENSYSANSVAEAETDNFLHTNYPHNQRQESSDNSSGITIKQRVSPKLDRPEDSSEPRRSLNLPQIRSQRPPPLVRIFSSFFTNLERFLIFCCIFLVVIGFAYFVVRFFMGYDYPPTSYENNQLSATTLVDRLRSKFKNQPPLTFRIISNALKNVLESKPKSPAIILLLATNGSKTVCSDFALNLVDSLSLPKYTVRIYGENYKQENAKHSKMEIDLIISKALKFNQMGSVLIDDLDQIPGQAAIILHKYYDHENAPFKKAVFVMTANYNLPISDYGDLKVWHKAANDHLLNAWSDAGIDQLSALLSRVTVNVAIITSETLY